MGLSVANLTAITFKDGRVEQNNFHDYPVLRIGQGAMDVRTYIMPHPPEVPAAGVGEPGVPPFAPAFINAYFAATGKRVRELPLRAPMTLSV